MKRVSIGFSRLPAGLTMISETADREVMYLAGLLLHAIASLPKVSCNPSLWEVVLCVTPSICVHKGQGGLKKTFSSGGNVGTTSSVQRKGLEMIEAMATRQFCGCGVRWRLLLIAPDLTIFKWLNRQLHFSQPLGEKFCSLVCESSRRHFLPACSSPSSSCIYHPTFPFFKTAISLFHIIKNDTFYHRPASKIILASSFQHF